MTAPSTGSADRDPPPAPQSAALLELLDWWRNARGDAPLPPRAAVDPSRFPRALPYTWLCDWNPTARSARMRLVGDEVERLYERSLRGQWVDAGASEETRQRMLTIYRRVAEEPCLYYAYGQVYRLTPELEGNGERMILPLGDDGRQITHLIGITVYALHGPPTARPQLPDAGIAVTDQIAEHFVSLAGATHWPMPNP